MRRVTQLAKFRPVPSTPLEMMTRGSQVAPEAAVTDADLADSESGTTCQNVHR